MYEFKNELLKKQDEIDNTNGVILKYIFILAAFYISAINIIIYLKESDITLSANIAALSIFASFGFTIIMMMKEPLLSFERTNGNYSLLTFNSLKIQVDHLYKSVNIDSNVQAICILLLFNSLVAFLNFCLEILNKGNIIIEVIVTLLLLASFIGCIYYKYCKKY